MIFFIIDLKLMAISFFHYLLFLMLFQGVGADEVSRCGGGLGPDIRFPFRLKAQHPINCGFELYCNHRNQTVLELPVGVKMIVTKIDYRSQSIHLYDPADCLPKQLPSLNLSASPFQFISRDGMYNFSLFKCPPPERHYYKVACLSVPESNVYAAWGWDDFYSLIYCIKIHNIYSVPFDIFRGDQKLLELTWKQPNCSECEAKGMMCSWKNYNSTLPQPQLQCLDMPKTPKGSSNKLLITGVIIGTIFLAMVIIALYRAYISHKIKKEDQVKIETFLEDYKALKPTRYTFADIKKITNQFKDKLGEGSYGTVFKGKLSSEIFVAVKVLNSTVGNGEEFINEVGTMARIHHVNIVRLLGFSADGNRRALVYDFLPNESLEKFIFSEHQKNIFLGWEKLQNIALGIAKGIEYLHQGCDHRILHFDIKPHNILLDHNFNPKIADFGLAKFCSKDQSIVSMTVARGTMGYIAPEVFSRNFGNVSYKSDVYSFGMLLLEIVGGRKNIDTTVQNTSQAYFPEWIYNRLSDQKDLGIRIEEEEHVEIAKKLTIVGLWCIQWYPLDRPCMKTVVQMLEGKVDTQTMPPNPFSSTVQSKCSIKPPRTFHTELDVISEEK